MMKIHLAAFVLIIVTSLQVSGCSDFLLNVTGDSIVSARTMDYQIDLKTVVEVIPRSTIFEEAPVFNCSDCPNYNWTSKYGFVAFNAEFFNFALDGMNEKGLSASWLYLTETQYPRPNLSDQRPIITNLCSYILGNFATIDEVKTGLKQIQIAELDILLMSLVVHIRGLAHLPLHMAVHDANGNNLVIEFLNGRTLIHDNPYGVMTNEPSFEWHMMNIKVNEERNTIPGGYSSVDRFMRLWLLNQYASVPYFPNTSYAKASPDQAAVSRAIHIINTVIRPPGIVGEPLRHDTPWTGTTQWSVVRDHRRLRIYFRSTENQLLRFVNLEDIDFGNTSSRQYIPVTYGDWAMDATLAITDPIHPEKTMDLPPRKVLEHLVHLTVDTSSSAIAIGSASLFLFHFTIGLVLGVIFTSLTVKWTTKWHSYRAL